MDRIRRMPICVPTVSRFRRMNLPQMAPQTHVQGNGHAHNHQRTDAQYQEPPDHPHSRLG
jgi:hypothetical protein